MVTLDIEALQFALACVKDDRFSLAERCRNNQATIGDWAPKYEAAERHLAELIEKAQA
jgi:hypothetical protein